MKITAQTLKQVTEAHAGQPLTRLQDKQAVYFRKLLHAALRKTGVSFAEIQGLTGWSRKRVFLDVRWVMGNATAITSVRALLYESEEAERAARAARKTMKGNEGESHD